MSEDEPDYSGMTLNEPLFHVPVPDREGLSTFGSAIGAIPNLHTELKSRHFENAGIFRATTGNLLRDCSIVHRQPNRGRMRGGPLDSMSLVRRNVDEIAHLHVDRLAVALEEQFGFAL